MRRWSHAEQQTREKRLQAEKLRKHGALKRLKRLSWIDSSLEKVQNRSSDLRRLGLEMSSRLCHSLTLLSSLLLLVSVHDHYRLLLSSLSNSTSSQPPTIDYDQRPPAPNLETSSKACLEEFESLMKNLKNLVKGDGSWYGRECLVRATTPEVIDFRSSVGREVSIEIKERSCVKVKFLTASFLYTLISCGSYLFIAFIITL